VWQLGSNPVRRDVPVCPCAAADSATFRELIAWSIPVGITLDQSPHVLLAVNVLEYVEALPLLVDKSLKAPATVQQSPVQIEDDGPDI
jgi:hypothetical protein